MAFNRSVLTSVFAFCFLIGAVPLTAQNLNIRCGITGSYTASDGTIWQGDQYYVGGQQDYSSYPVTNTPDPTLYRYARDGYYGDLNYNIPLANGSYQVTLKFAEIKFWAVGQRIFNVSFNGTAVLTNFDIVAQAGGWNAIDKQFPATVTNGTLNINFHGITNYGLVNAIQIVSSAPAVTSVAPTSLTFNATSGGANPSAQSLNITNSGAGTLNWSASKTQSWLTLSAAGGAAPSTLSVSANIATLTPGTYTDTITITGGASPVTVAVSAVVAAGPATLTVSSSSLSFAGLLNGTNPVAQTLNIGNSGGGTVNWSASKTQSWLTLSPAFGTAPTSMAVSVSTAGLASGTYADSITVTASGVAGSPKTVSVSLVVTGPTLSVSPGSLSFSATAGGSNPVSQTLSISNTGGGSLSWTASKTSTWLTLSSPNGSAPSSLVVGANISGLTNGTYSDTITISASGASGTPQLIGVTLVVGAAAPPVLSVSTNSASFTATAGGSNPATQNISISNTGSGTLNWTASKNQSWLTLSSPGGTAPSTLGLTANISGLNAGSYSDTVTIAANGATGSPQTISVSLVVSSATPVLSISTNTASFTATAGGSNPAIQNINISNTGGGTLNWTASKNQSWLTLSSPSGTAPSTLGLTANISGLNAGTYNDTVTITANGATGSPQTVSVSLVVSAAATATNSAAFVRLDTTTEGNWINAYGADGYSIEAVTPALPAYAQVSVSGSASTYTWNGGTSYVPALQYPTGSSRIASTWYSSGSFSFDVNITDGGQHQVAIYSLDYDGAGRSQRVDILDATTSAVLDSRQMTGFVSGEYAAWNITGHVTIKVTLLTGSNAVVSGIFFDTAGKTPTSTAAFIKLDTTAQGNWINTYGADGNDIPTLTSSIPSYAKIIVNSASTFVWGGSPSDPRALQIPPSGSTRIAPCWYGSSFNFDINFTDGNAHQLALYALDFDNSSRVERIDVTDAVTGVVLDSRTLSSFTNGQYPVWNLQGHLIIRVTLLSGLNAVVSGLFFEPAQQTLVPILSVAPTTVTLTGTLGGSAQVTSNVAISNTGGGTLNWTASGTQSWLTLSATSGTAPASLTVGANIASLNAGNYTDTVTISSSNATGSPKLVTVNLSVTAPPTLSLSSSSLSFSGVTGAANPASQSVNISNSGSGTLTWTAMKTQTWLTLSQTGGTAPASLGFSVSTSGLTQGTYTDTVTITASGATQSPQTVKVTLVVSPPAPTLSVSSNSVSFSATAGGTNPTSQAITISNTGSGTVTWTASNSHSWLTLSSAGGTAPSTLTLNASITGLGTGTYTDTVVINAGTAANSPQSIAVTLVVTSGTASAASFVKIDTTTEGSWTNVYGANGYDFIGASASLPSYAQMAVNGAFIFTWNGSTSDARALQVPGSARAAGTWYASGSFSFDLNLTDGQTHQISLYALDFDSSGRAERINILDAASGTLLDSRTLSAFSSGQWAVWNISGHVTIQVTQLTGPNAVISGVFFDNAGAAPVSSTLFEGVDSTTLGSWENGYGGDGYDIEGLPSALPAYASVSVGSSAQTFIWNGGTTDTRALEIPNSQYRIASTWYSTSSLSFDVNLTDGNVHRIALYALDFDNGGRNETVSVIDTQTGVTLDSRTIGPFTQGEYLVWNLAGHVVFQVTNNGGENAVISGIFFGQSPLVKTPTTLSLSNTNLTFAGVINGANPSPLGVSITNSGIGTLNWTATSNQPWLTISSPSGTAPSILSIGANLTGLSAGTYTGTVGVAAPGALGTPQAINVTLNVRSQPAILNLSQTGLTFATSAAGTNPAQQTVAITNTGTGTLSWTAAATHTWVTLSASSGTAPSNLLIGVNTAGLANGVYTDTVVISANGASSSPQSVTVTLIIGAANGQHYVSPQGTPSGDGSINNPWDLQTALFQPASVVPGDTIWVRGGTYGNGQGIFYSRLVGTAQLPIIVRQFPGERATIDGWLQVGCCDQAPNSALGAYVWIWGLEFASSITDRTGLPNGQSATLDAIDTWAPGTKIINNIVHDTRLGISMWKEAVGAEAYGNVVYFNGFQASDRAHGHGFYVQNNTPTMNVTNNIIFDQFDEGMQFYGSSAAQVKDLTVQGNISFNNGIISAGPQLADDVIFVNTNGLAGIQLLSNYFYFTPQLALGYNEMGWPGPNQDITITGNVFAGGFESLAMTDWASINFQNNTVYSNNFSITYSNGSTPSGYTWDNNTYYGSGLFSYNGQSTTFGGWLGWTGWDSHSTSTTNSPTGIWCYVMPNKYEPNRANIVVYNWNLASTVSVDVSSAIAVGTRYKVLDAENIFGAPVATGTYTGGTITIPMTGLTIATPNGTVPNVPSHTAPQFGAFVLEPLQ